MNVSKRQSRERFKKYYFEFPKFDLAVDLSRMEVSDEFFATLDRGSGKCRDAKSG